MRKYLPDKYTYDNTSFTEKQGKDIVGIQFAFETWFLELTKILKKV